MGLRCSSGEDVGYRRDQKYVYEKGDKILSTLYFDAFMENLVKYMAATYSEGKCNIFIKFSKRAHQDLFYSLFIKEKFCFDPQNNILK